MRILLITILFVALSGCDTFKLEHMGGVGESCFNNDTCTGDLVCVYGVCEELDESDESDQSEVSDQSEFPDESDQSEFPDESDDSDQSDEDLIEDLCNFGEICWKVVPTQQKRCFNETGTTNCTEVTSTFYGQDGLYADSSTRGFENIKFGDKYFVFDNRTKLLWYKTASENPVNFSDAQAFCEILNSTSQGERTNWRIPYLHELVSIVNFDETIDPLVDGFYFPFLKKEKYWTLTKLGGNNKYYVDFSGSSQFYVDDGSSKMNSAICVSSDHIYDTERKFNRFLEFPFEGDVTVEDKLTGLVWQKVTDYSARIWKDALAYCESLSFAGKTDWRLPNVNELHSLATYEIDYELQTVFPDLGDDFFWSSTTNANVIQNAWVVEFKYGILKPELPKDKNENQIYTMCVRNKD